MGGDPGVHGRGEIVILSAVKEEPAEVLDGVPVLAAEARVVTPPRGGGAVTPVAVQTVAVMGASMLAGAAAVAVARGRRARRLERRRRRALGPVVASRSFLVDIHVLGNSR